MRCVSWDLLLRQDPMQLCRGIQGLWTMVGTGRLMPLLQDGKVGLWSCHKIRTFSSWVGWVQVQEVWGILGGSPEHPEQQEAARLKARHGSSCGGEQGEPTWLLHGSGG